MENNEDILKEEVSDEVIDKEVESLEFDDEMDVQIDQNEELEKKISELTDKNVRLLAEYQNFKRRSTEDAQKSKAHGKKEVITEIIDTVDNLERALTLVTDDNKSDFTSGVEMVYTNLVKKLTNLGVEQINCEGLLDPNIHHAVGTDCIEEVDNDVITEVFQKGYIVDGIIIRTAMVKVNQK